MATLNLDIKMENNVKDAKDILEQITEDEIAYVDFRFTDLFGNWKHISYTSSCINQEMLVNGFTFDASSISGWSSIEKSDMILKPDCATAVVDNFMSVPHLIVVCDVLNPTTGALYDKSPRSIIKKAEEYLHFTGIADTFYIGPEPEFFIFDEVEFSTEDDKSMYEISSAEINGLKSENKEGNFFPYMPKRNKAYFLHCPSDLLFDLRDEMVTSLADMGVRVEKHHHEVARCQHEIVPVFDNFVTQADTIQILKYVIRSVALSYNKAATFMPKPLASENGSGLHLNCSLWKNGKSLFFGNGYSKLSEIALYFIGGVLRHARALNAFTNPTINSYKRLIKGFEAPVLLTYSSCNRSAACRIPLSVSAEQKRVEIRFPDPSSNPYLAFSAILMAGIDGIENKITPPAPMEENLFALGKEEMDNIPSLCGNLEEALEELNNDRDFLLKGNVFTSDAIDAYIALKRKEIAEYYSVINPIDFKMYF